MIVPPVVKLGRWHRVRHPKFSEWRSAQPKKTQIRQYQRIKKIAQEWEQKYYEKKARSIKILQADTMRVADVSSSKKPVLASKV